MLRIFSSIRKAVSVAVLKIIEKKYQGKQPYLYYNHHRKKLLIVFSAFNKSKVRLYNYLNCLSYTKEFDRLYILDPWGVRGSYNLYENGQDYPEKITTALIELIISRGGYECVYTAGSSKGGTCAIYFGLKIGAQKIFSGACQYNIGTYLYQIRDDVFKGMMGADAGEKERDLLNVVYDQVGSPTSARDLAVAIYAVLESKEWHAGIYHFTDEGVCSWYDFTREIHSLYNSQEVLRAYNRGDVQAAGQVVIQCEVKPILSSEYPTKTPRPHYSVLDKAKIKNTFGIEIPYWRDSLAQCIARL